MATMRWISWPRLSTSATATPAASPMPRHTSSN
jgi:hypothetical protein